jgi:hypothetical protein
VNELLRRLRDHILRKPCGVGPGGTKFRAVAAATPELLRDAEARLGFALPAVLRSAYLDVANGGFGPGYGVMGVGNGFVDDLKQTVVDAYLNYRCPDPEDPAWQWPEAHLPICHWGCAIYSVVDCSRQEAPVFFVDPGARELGAPMSDIFIAHRPSLDDWLTAWLDGKDLWKEVWS